MCMKTFCLQRCLCQAKGGCEEYYAEYVGEQECNKMMLPGLPYPDCRAVWAGFEDEVSTKVNRHTYYTEKSKGLCPTCLHKREVAYLQEEAMRERRGEYSDSVKALIADLTRRAELNQGAFMARCYNEMWDAARNLASGLNAKADMVWDGIETALWGHFGVQGMALPVVQGLIASLQDAKRELVGCFKKTTREMATALVGPKDNWEEDVEAAKHAEEDWERQRQAAAEAANAATLEPGFQTIDDSGFGIE
ncbi:hypothetical protein EsH8_VI_001186 [Colletotrichum jinshuiense]